METSEWRKFRYDADMYERSILRKYAEFFEDEVSSLVFELARCGSVDEALMIKAHRPQFSIIVTRIAERLQSLSEASQ
ncbi:MAG: hypothetical protein M3P06_16720 [Acidobacteriota bacterium]|nr:hypothetical protein [Acidobacteriota bacterium]